MNKPVERKECPFQPSISPKRSRWKEDKWVLQPVPILLRERKRIITVFQDDDCLSRASQLRDLKTSKDKDNGTYLDWFGDAVVDGRGT